MQASSSSDEDVPVTICLLCKEEFPDMARRSSHFIKCKNQTKCKLCQMSCSYFGSVKNLKAHTKICNGLNNFHCPYCKKIFKKKVKLVTCTCTTVHKGSNVRYVVVNLALNKIFTSMWQRSTEFFLVISVILKWLQRAY